MSADDTASLIYLGLLALALVVAFVLASRGRMGAVLTQMALWVLIFLGVVAAYGLWPEIEDAVRPRQATVLTDGGAVVEAPRAFDGHYYLDLDVNGVPVTFTVDTGATEIVLSRDDARRAGIEPDALAYLGSAFTANGQVRTARVMLDELSLEGGVDRDVPAVVTDGDLNGSLLGMTYLSRFARIEIAGDRMVLTR